MWGRDSQRLADHESHLLRDFWQAAHEAAFPLPNAFPPDHAGTDNAKVLLIALTDAHFAAERAVLHAAFASPAPLTSAPLLSIVADGLGPALERLTRYAPYYDLACRFEGCVGKSSEPAGMFRLMGTLVSADQLGTSLDATTQVRGEWRNVFAELREGHAALWSAYGNATGRDSADPAEMLTSPPPLRAQPLAALVARSVTAWKSYDRTGLFDPYAVGVLRTGLQASKRAAIVTQFEQRRGALATVLGTHEDKRGTFANLVLQSLHDDAGRSRVQADLDLLLKQLVDKSQDVYGLQKAEAQATRSQADEMAAFLAQTEKNGWPADYQVNRLQPFDLQLDARHARAEHNFVGLDDVPKVAVLENRNDPTSAWKRLVKKGNMLQISVEESWAPTCALRGIGTLGGPFEVPTNVLAGPEGYTIEYSGGSYRAQSLSFSDTYSESNKETGSLCGNLSYGASGGGTGAGVTATGCRTSERGTTWSGSDNLSIGHDKKKQANFSGGLRMPNAPFPTFPVGALLLVEMATSPAGEWQMADVYVVRRNSTFVFDHDAELYLVVNDIVGCNELNTSHITVRGYVTESLGDAATRLTNVMADTLADMRAKRQLMVDQGSLSSADLDQLRTAAYARLLATCGQCSLESFPPAITKMFDAWIAGELANVDREVRIANLDREEDDLALRITAISADLSAAKDQARVLDLMTTWQLRYLTAHDLSDSARFLFEYANDYVFPLFELRYPAALAQLHFEGALEALRTTDWTHPDEELVEHLLAAAATINHFLDTAELDTTNRPAPIAVLFPKPGATGDGGPPMPIVAGASGLKWVQADPARLEQVWESYTKPDGSTDYRLRRQATFEIAPQDVYKPSDTAEVGGLFCNEATPVVRSMAIYAINNGDSGDTDWNASPLRRRQAQIKSQMTFAHEVGGRSYRIETPGWQKFSMRILTGTEGSALSTYAQYRGDETVADGLSPFNSYTVNFGAYLDEVSPLTAANAVLVLFDVEARGATDDLAWIEACR
jgi:hypothetical protein